MRVKCISSYISFKHSLWSMLTCLILWLYCNPPVSLVETTVEQDPIADAGPDVYGNAFSADTKGSINLTAAKAYDPDGGECECVWLLAGTTLAEGCSTSVLLDTGRYVIVLQVTDNEEQWTTDTINATISRCAVVSHEKDTIYDFLTSLGCMNDYDLLAGDPLIYLYGGVRSVKFVYDLGSRILYYTHTKKYELHYSFCYEYLNYKKDYSLFHREQWVQGPQRRFLLGSGDWDFGLSARSDKIRLFNASAKLIDEVTYANTPPWPFIPDTLFATLALNDAASDNAVASSWHISGGTGGTPGRKNGRATSVVSQKKIPYNGIPVRIIGRKKQNILVSIHNDARVSMRVYSLRGQTLACLLNNRLLTAGNHKISTHFERFAAGVSVLMTEITYQDGKRNVFSIKITR